MTANVAVETTPEVPLWNDPSHPVSARVDALIGAMTLQEKIAQLYGVWVGASADGGEVAPHQHDMEGHGADERVAPEAPEAPESPEPAGGLDESPEPEPDSGSDTESEWEAEVEEPAAEAGEDASEAFCVYQAGGA